MNKKYILGGVGFIILILIGINVHKYMVMNDIEFDFLSSIKDKISKIQLFGDSDDEVDLGKYVNEKEGDNEQKSEYNDLSDKKFIENRYKLLKEKKLEKLYQITSFALGYKPFDVFKKWYENLVDLKIVGISKRDDGSYQIVVDVWYKGKYKDAKLGTWHKNYYDLQCIPGETDTGYYKRIVVYKKVVNENGIKKLQTIKVNLKQTLALPYNFKGEKYNVIKESDVSYYLYNETNLNSSSLDGCDNCKNNVDSVYDILKNIFECQKNKDIHINGNCYNYGNLVYGALYDQGRSGGPSYLGAIGKGKDFIISFIKYTIPDLTNYDKAFWIENGPISTEEELKTKNEMRNIQKNINIYSDLIYFDFKKNKKYLFMFNIAKYACDLGYNKLYFSIDNLHNYGENEFPYYQRKNYVIWDSIAKAVNNGPEDYLKNAFSSYFK